MKPFSGEWLHYQAGYVIGRGLQKLGIAGKIAVIQALDRFGYEREWQQNLIANNPNAVLSKHQLREAMAWGAGARAASGAKVSYPAPYPKGSTWT